MVVQLRPRAITVERGSRGFGLSLIYRGLDKYEEKDTGIFVARVVPGGKENKSREGLGSIPALGEIFTCCCSLVPTANTFIRIRPQLSRLLTSLIVANQLPSCFDG